MIFIYVYIVYYVSTITNNLTPTLYAAQNINSFGVFQCHRNIRFWTITRTTNKMRFASYYMFFT